jgi:hypothetical protein
MIGFGGKDENGFAKRRGSISARPFMEGKKSAPGVWPLNGVGEEVAAENDWYLDAVPSVFIAAHRHGMHL